jgi:hypothetical protein
MCFEVALRGRTEDKVSVKFNGNLIWPLNNFFHRNY